MKFLRGLLKANQSEETYLDDEELFKLCSSMSNNPEEIDSFIFKIRSEEKKDEGPKADRIS